MCGISGISFKRSSSEINILKVAKEMNKALIHRGPDDSDYWKNDSNSLVFSHRRLSILDISKNGSQPMVSKSKRYIICFQASDLQRLQIEFSDVSSSIPLFVVHTCMHQYYRTSKLDLCCSSMRFQHFYHLCLLCSSNFGPPHA